MNAISDNPTKDKVAAPPPPPPPQNITTAVGASISVI